MIGKVDEITFEITPNSSIDISYLNILLPMILDKDRLRLFIQDRLPKEYNPLIKETLAKYNMIEFNLVELAKKSRCMKHTDYFWIATEDNINERLEDFHLLFR
ncbi:MAG: hypothetical protein ACRC5M_07200 [Anaeroplasmataceae bacterium]